MTTTTIYNPLDQFQSYSIHHVMLACRTTKEATAFMDDAKNQSTLQAIEQVTQLGAAVPYGNNDTAFLVLDTRRFSQFSVANMKNEVLINSFEQTGSPSNVVQNMSMTVVDSTGISFINFMQWLMNTKMKTNFDGIVFIYKVIFVGHLPDGNSETVHGPTFPLLLTKMEVNLDHAKGTYALELMPYVNFDTVRHSRWTNIANVSRYFTGAESNTLGSMVKNFETQLNKASSDYYNRAQEQFKKLNLSSDGKKFGRRVQYIITLPESWYGMDFTGAATAKATETIFTNELKKKKDAFTKAREDEEKAKSKLPSTSASSAVPVNTHFAAEPGMSIPEVLDLMFKQVKGVAALGTGAVKTEGDSGSLKFYKHMTGITTDDDVMYIQVHVVEFEVPNVVPTSNTGGISKHYVQLDDGTKVPKNYAEFDYIYTGKNKDILTFDMKIENLQILLQSNPAVGPASLGITEHPKPGSEKLLKDPPDKTAELVNARPYDALLLPQNTDLELKNFQNYTSLMNSKESQDAIRLSQDYARNLSAFYATNNFAVNITIRGNPYIMAKFTTHNFLPHIPNQSQNPDGGVPPNRQQLERDILSNNMHNDPSGSKVSEIIKEGEKFKVVRSLGNDNYTASPVFVKLNVNGPNVDFLTGKQDDTQYAKALIENNFLVIFKVTNTIEGHNFTQELELKSHSIYGVVSKDSKKEKTA